MTQSSAEARRTARVSSHSLDTRLLCDRDVCARVSSGIAGPFRGLRGGVHVRFSRSGRLVERGPRPRISFTAGPTEQPVRYQVEIYLHDFRVPVGSQLVQEVNLLTRTVRLECRAPEADRPLEVTCAVPEGVVHFGYRIENEDEPTVVEIPFPGTFAVKWTARGRIGTWGHPRRFAARSTTE